MLEADRKYLNDVKFKRLVDMVLSLVRSQESSFAEVREAVLFAQLRYEMDRPPTTYFSPDLQRELFHRMDLDRILLEKP